MAGDGASVAVSLRRSRPFDKPLICNYIADFYKPLRRQTDHHIARASRTGGGGLVFTHQAGSEPQLHQNRSAQSAGPTAHAGRAWQSGRRAFFVCFLPRFSAGFTPPLAALQGQRASKPTIIAGMMNRWKPSATVAAVIERDFDGVQKFLLVEELTRDGLRLNNPAGHLDPGESPAQACRRETLEETAFHFTPTQLVGVYLSRFERTEAEGVLDITYLRFAFCGELGAFVDGMALDDGIVRTVWLTADEIRACTERHRSPLLLQCMEDYLAGCRFPLALITTDSSVLLQKK